MNTEDDINLVAALAQEVEITDSINWDMLNLSYEQMYGTLDLIWLGQ